MKEEVLRVLKPFADASRRCQEFGTPRPEAFVFAEDDNCAYELYSGEEGAIDQRRLTVADLHVAAALYDILVAS